MRSSPGDPRSRGLPATGAPPSDRAARLPFPPPYGSSTPPVRSLSPLLARLEREGLLSAEWLEGEGPRPRKYYHLTAVGRARMKKMSEEFRAVAAGIEQMIAGALGGRR